MKFYHIGNASFLFETKMAKILCDPWFTTPIYVGTWYHYPPNVCRIEDYQKSDYLFISHIHEDHFDVQTLKTFDKDIPILCLERQPNFVASGLRRLGFNNIVLCKEKEIVDIDGKFKVVLFGSAPNEMGELVDSSILFDFGEEGIVFNGNDNRPTADQLEYIKDYCSDSRLLFGLIPQGGGSAFPVRYDNLTAEAKKSVVKQSIENRLNYFSYCVEQLNPEFTMPVGGQFVIAGNTPEENRLMSKPYLEADGPNRFKEKFPGKSNEFFFMKSGDVFDFERKLFLQGDGKPFSAKGKDEFIMSLVKEERPEIIKFHKDFRPKKLYELFQICRMNCWNFQRARDLYFDYNMYFDVEGEFFGLNYLRPDVSRMTNEHELEKPYMKITLSCGDFLALLVNTLDWNHADGASRLRFFRDPEIYNPQAYVLLSMLHL